MEEISVVVQQEVGSISWNFEDIKKNLASQLEIFKKTVYTDDTIKSAKSDVANLRKLAKEIEDRRKEVKAKCLEPYDIIEAQAKELVSLIDEPIRAINAQVDDYENRRKEAVRAKIEDYWQKKSEKLPEDLRKKAHDKLYDSRWENATTTMKAWKDAIDAGIERILKDLETIASFKSEYEEDMMQVYQEQLNLQPAIMKMNQLNAQRDRILEQERRKKEEEERRAAEEAAKQAEKEEEPAPQEPQIQPEKPKAENVPVVQETPKQEPVAKQDEREREVITLFGTREQIEKIKKYIVYSGADWQEGVAHE